MQRPFSGDMNFTLDGLRMWKIFEYDALIEEQSLLASGEQELQATLDQIRAVWEDRRFAVTVLPERDVIVLEGLSDILDLVQDHQVLLQGRRSVAGSPS